MVSATKDEKKQNVKVHVDTQAQQHEATAQAAGQGQTAVEQARKQEVQTPRGVERTRTGRVYAPAVDIFETRDAVVLVADMPGVDENAVDVTLEKNVLTIYGHVDLQHPAGHSLTYAEYGLGDYQRSFTISNEIDWQRIEGAVKNGVLRLTLPKAGPAETRKIEIKPAQ